MDCDLLTKSVVKGRFEREIFALGMVRCLRAVALSGTAQAHEIPQRLVTDQAQDTTTRRREMERGADPYNVGLIAGLVSESIVERVVPMSLVKSKQRVADHGEVFTPEWLVEAMLDLVKEETERIDSRVLETACGSGNFLVRVLQRKLAAVQLKFGKSDFEKRHYALLGLMCIYGIELLPDNIAECRANMLEILADYLSLGDSDVLYLAASYVLSQNLVHGDAVTMLNHQGQPITFAEWGYVGKGKFQRRDFRFDTLTQSAAFGAEDTLFADLGKHEVFVPSKIYPLATVGDLAEVTE